MAPNHHPDPFWDFIRSIDPNAGPQPGVDRSFPAGVGFPFFHNGPPHGGPRHHHHHRRGPPQYHPWAGGPFGWAAWAPDAEDASQGQRAAAASGTAPQQASGGDAAAASAAATAAAASGEKGKQKGTEKTKDDSPDTMMGDDFSDPAEVTPDEDEDENAGPQRGPRGRGRGRCGGPRYARRSHNSDNAAPFDISTLLSQLNTHPLFQNIISNLQPQPTSSSSSSSPTGNTSDQSFTPPLDLFNTDRAYILHLALPGAKKEHIGVDWDPEAGTLKIAGVVHRPGDEELLRTLVGGGERSVGVFERSVRLPPAGTNEKEEVDGFGIAARMEDGVLVITVPKVEKEWTEIHKVDIE